jgi:hypothetical protein
VPGAAGRVVRVFRGRSPLADHDAGAETGESLA